MGDVFKALADPTRRAILDELTERDGQTLFELWARLATNHGMGSTRQPISQHVDVATEYERLVGRGVRFTQPPADMGPVTTAVFDDTCGNLIQIAAENH